MADTPAHRFPKAEKLKSRKQIDLIFRQGKSFFAAPVKCYYRLGALEGEIRNGEEDFRFTNYELRFEGGKRNPEQKINPLPGGVAGDTDPKDENLLSGRGGPDGEIRNAKYEIRKGEEDLRFKIYDLRLEEKEEGKTYPEQKVNPLPGGVAGDTDPKDENLLSGRGGPVGEMRNEEPDLRFTNYDLRFGKLEEGNINPEQEIELQTSNLKPQTPNIKAGFSVSKKQFKKAVDRNRVKRLMREAYRLHKQKLLTQAAEKNVTIEVFFVFTDRTLPSFALVEEKMKYCLRRLGKMVEGNV